MHDRHGNTIGENLMQGMVKQWPAVSARNTLKAVFFMSFYPQLNTF
ncbi:hypothetical protein [Metabacillus fastidiosus]